MRNSLKLLFLCIVFVLLTACGARTTLAPVVEGWKQPASKSGTYIVQPGDTLYSIAWAFDMDYRALARANHLSPNAQINPGQRLSMHTVATPKVHESIFRFTANKPRSKKVPKKAAVRHKPRLMTVRSKNIARLRWYWPAHGKVVGRFSTQLGKNKGINIAGRSGEVIRSTAAGRVVYSGMGLRGYGKLIIIKHNDSYLSAYAYNKKILVHEGERVKARQVIARMGKSYTGKTMLHFEIRRNGKPVNPMRYLKRV